MSHSPVITTPQDLLREAKYDLKLFWPSGSSHIAQLATQNSDPLEKKEIALTHTRDILINNL